ncbi:hypothetical protein Q765_06095 [Flavobacterium rivuli WB 3.3-2 = DSM 21788]|uniref:Uncharacterized protein n=1 Tax=Flavobacterium rivuli WB 3.3-2 = DSM 21788 TaxID=1121895 RepID=A0A0A2M3N7_9FLAO|nr:hypothetical protein [Flavobacterium rivuli]KGO87237.1 hypothetical protein Q765_06095 [Flavobacterium rivuli WB 3.3-2 = DSM 21788]
MITWLDNSTPVSATTIALLRTFFVGFGLIIPALLYVKPKKSPDFKNIFIATSIQIIRLIGILYFILWVLDAQSATSIAPAEGGYAVTMGPPFYIGGSFYIFWLTPLIFLLTTQLFWIAKVRANKIIVLVLSLLMLLNSFNVFSLLLTKLKITMPIVWAWPSADNGMFAVAVLLHLFMFACIVFTTMVVSGRLKENKV